MHKHRFVYQGMTRSKHAHLWRCDSCYVQIALQKETFVQLATGIAKKFRPKNVIIVGLNGGRGGAITTLADRLA